MTAVDVAGRFWDALYERDWQLIRSFFDADSIYYDVPTGPSSAARGPEDIEARLQLGLLGLAGYEHAPGAVVASAGDGIVMTEHTEVWHWSSGETVALPFVSVQHVHGEVIAIWKDYWDYNTLINAAPAWWVEEIMSADLSWVFDATGVM
jgi:limonene-1,2-epoxide hydrolase